MDGWMGRLIDEWIDWGMDRQTVGIMLSGSGIALNPGSCSSMGKNELKKCGKYANG